MNFTIISVYVEKEVHPIYEQLVSRGAKQVEDRPFATMKDIFILAACFGAKHNQFKKLGASRDIFSGELFNANKTDAPVLAALAYFHTKDTEVLSDPKRIIEIAQGFANAGIHLLKEELLGRPGRPLHNLVEFILSEHCGQGDYTDNGS
jgi:dnd system-associated protein 4